MSINKFLNKFIKFINKSINCLLLFIGDVTNNNYEYINKR